MLSLALVLFVAGSAGAATSSAERTTVTKAPGIACGTVACPNPWDCWTVSVTYRKNVADPGTPPLYITGFIEFLHEPGNIWAFREDAECHARKAALEGIMGPLNFPDNDERVYIPPAAIENIRIWKVPMPNFGH